MAHDFKRGKKLPYEDIDKIEITKLTDIPFVTFANCGEALVQEGDAVCIGSPLCKNADGRFVRASVSGKISSLNENIITVENDFQMALSSECVPFGVKTGKKLGELELSELVQVVQNCGITEGEDEIPLGKLLGDSYGRIKTLVVNAVVTEQTDLAPLAVLESYTAEIISAMKIIMSVMGVKKGIVALASHSKHTCDKLESHLNGHLIKVEKVSDNYPLQNKYLLLYALSGKELSPLHESYVSGYLVLSPKTCLDVYNAFAQGRCADTAIFSLTPSSSQTLVISAPIGTDVGYICRKFEIEDKLCQGSPLSQNIISKDEKISQGLTRLCETHISKRAILACNKCSDCVSVCPMFLFPFEFAFSGKRHAQNCGINVCIECGLCDTVCPTGFSLLEKIKSLKKQLSE